MKAVILAGGMGTRISEETGAIPKPMIQIGGKPIIWHIMKLYSHHGINDFVICLGYKGYVIKEYFANYYRHMSDLTIDLRNNSEEIHSNTAEPWRITLVETGLNSMTGGRIKKVQNYIKDDEAFCLTYGDGVADIDITKSIAFHKSHGKLATITATQPMGRFGVLDMGADNKINGFIEKPKGDGAFINGGFFVLSPKVLPYIAGDDTIWEKEPLEKLVKDNQLMAFEHTDFWHPMDTVRDKTHLESLWDSGNAPWKQWKD